MSSGTHSDSGGILMIQTKNDLHEYLEEDRKALGRSKSFKNINDLVYRYEKALRYSEYWSKHTRNLYGKFQNLFWRYVKSRLGQRCCFTIPNDVVGKGLCLVHLGPVVISQYAKIGDYCRIHICVNIGADARKEHCAPQIGNNVYIAPGAKLFGDITIGDDVAIGANAVVNKSFPGGVSIAGVPATVINTKGSRGIINRNKI